MTTQNEMHTETMIIAATTTAADVLGAIIDAWEDARELGRRKDWKAVDTAVNAVEAALDDARLWLASRNPPSLCCAKCHLLGHAVERVVRASNLRAKIYADGDYNEAETFAVIDILNDAIYAASDLLSLIEDAVARRSVAAANAPLPANEPSAPEQQQRAA